MQRRRFGAEVRARARERPVVRLLGEESFDARRVSALDGRQQRRVVRRAAEHRVRVRAGVQKSEEGMVAIRRRGGDVERARTGHGLAALRSDVGAVLHQSGYQRAVAEPRGQVQRRRPRRQNARVHRSAGGQEFQRRRAVARRRDEERSLAVGTGEFEVWPLPQKQVDDGGVMLRDGGEERRGAVVRGGVDVRPRGEERGYDFIVAAAGSDEKRRRPTPLLPQVHGRAAFEERGNDGAKAGARGVVERGGPVAGGALVDVCAVVQEQLRDGWLVVLRRELQR
mmetsp:Transcript_29424/g.101738  ORF Transcript_29424/g.101738 Transcript_29424/m.101738 type:complete len:282 (-) Transcript_29424:459-1304(-)